MTIKKEISVASEYSRVPYGRYPEDGPFNGERFRKEILVPALRESDSVLVNLDGARGYGSSFLDEAFGGLVRIEGFEESDLRARLEIKSKFASYVAEAWDDIHVAQQKKLEPT